MATRIQSPESAARMAVRLLGVRRLQQIAAGEDVLVRFAADGVAVTFHLRPVDPEPVASELFPNGPAPGGELPAWVKGRVREVWDAVCALRDAPGGLHRRIGPTAVRGHLSETLAEEFSPRSVDDALAKLVDVYGVLSRDRRRGYVLVRDRAKPTLRDDSTSDVA